MAPTEPTNAAADTLPLLERAPRLIQQVGHVPLGTYPTPLQPVEVAGRRVLVKRDDLCAADYAGNKVRKLEFLLAEALNQGAGRIVTAGATGSHHAFATAWHGRRLGLQSTLVLFPQRLTPHVREMLLLMHATGAELRWVRRMEGVPFGLWRARLAHRATSPAAIPPGGSSAVGALGYVNAGLEVAAQMQAEGDVASAIHIAAGTLGTVAGLAIGLAWAGMPVPIQATRITSRLVTNERVLHGLVRDTLSLLQHSGARDLPDAGAAAALVQLRHDQIGTGYGHATPQAEQAEADFAAAGLHLDPTYTAKAAAALLHDSTQPAAGTPLFWHTLSAVTPAGLLDREAELLATLPAPFRDYLQRQAAAG